MKSERLNLKYALLLAYYWLCCGFFLGTLTLIGPVRVAVSRARAAGWADSSEKLTVLFFIVLLLLVSFLAARLLADRTAAAARGKGRALAAAALAVTALSLWAWLTPKLMIGSGLKEASWLFSGAEFVFGPYPEAELMLKLKQEKYTAIISLLSPAVVPFEPMLIEKEKALAAGEGLELIQLPMLPWVSSNEQAPGKIREILARGGGKYYVHCYLGKDRVNVFRKLLGAVSAEARTRSLGPSGMRTLKDIKAFERGRITPLEDGVFLAPYPTDEEFFGYILNGGAATLVSLLDPGNPENRTWMEKEKALAAKYGLKLANYPWVSLDKAGKARAITAIKALDRPLVVHAFLAGAPECADFISYYSPAGPGRP